MYTFIISAAISFLIAAMLFGKKLKENLFFTALIIVGGSLIGVSIVNGVVGMKTPLTGVKVREYPLDEEISRIVIGTDTTIFLSVLEFTYLKKPSGKISERSLDFANVDYYSADESIRLSHLTIDWLEEGDTIPRHEVWKEKRIIKDNRWVTHFGIPDGKKFRRVYIPQDSIHIFLAKELNDKFFKNDETKIALPN